MAEMWRWAVSTTSVIVAAGRGSEWVTKRWST